MPNDTYLKCKFHFKNPIWILLATWTQLHQKIPRDPESNISWANVGPNSRRQYVESTYTAVWDIQTIRCV